MLALRFGDIDWSRQLIVLRGETIKSRKTRMVPIATARLLAVLKWLHLDAAGENKADDVFVFSDESGDPVGRSRTAERYDNQKLEHLQVAAGKLESGKSFDTTGATASMMPTKFQDSFKKRRKSPRSSSGQTRGADRT